VLDGDRLVREVHRFQQRQAFGLPLQGQSWWSVAIESANLTGERRISLRNTSPGTCSASATTAFAC
jgi:hypothetical protein